MFTLNCKGRIITINTPVVMGIINTTPDSFYAGSRFSSEDRVLEQAEKMMIEGATFIDIGAQSTRPGSERVSADEELKRVIRSIELIAQNFPQTILSIDTYHAKVAREAVAAGAAMVNDISAGSIDSEMIHTVAALHVPYTCMHMRGTPENMQQQVHYEQVTREVLDFFIRKVEELTKAGIHDIIVDPGFGFGKKPSHNFQLLKELHSFRMLNKPILVGISRKATVYRTLDIPVEASLNGTTVLHTLAIQNGANILRVHDVKEAMEVINLWKAYESKELKM